MPSRVSLQLSVERPHEPLVIIGVLPFTSYKSTASKPLTQPSPTATSRPIAARRSVLRADSAVADKTSTCNSLYCLPLPRPRLQRRPEACALWSLHLNWSDRR